MSKTVCAQTSGEGRPVRRGQSMKRQSAEHFSGRVRLVCLVLFNAACACDSSQLSSVPDDVHRLDRPITRVAFGSCNDAFAEQPLWSVIAARRPDVFLWTGDIVYADVANIPPVRGQVYWRLPLPRVATHWDLRAHYALQKKIPDYAHLRRNTRILGIYDDHDYGKNNGGREFGLREESRLALLDFLDEPHHSPRRSRPGAYAAYDFKTVAGPLRIILLDTRYNRDAPGINEDILGETQWSWFKAQLTSSPARFHWLVSSIQVLPEEHPYEAWARFPSARRRLIRLLETTRPRGLVLLSGDRHLAEISRIRTPGGFDLIEVTSSGMTHHVPQDWKESNRYRTGELYGGLNFGMGSFESKATMVISIHGNRGQNISSIQIPGSP